MGAPEAVAGDLQGVPGEAGEAQGGGRPANKAAEGCHAGSQEGRAEGRGLSDPSFPSLPADIRTCYEDDALKSRVLDGHHLRLTCAAARSLAAATIERVSRGDGGAPMSCGVRLLLSCEFQQETAPGRQNIK